MSELLKKLMKNSTIAETALLRKSMIYGAQEFAPTPVPMINVALSGKLDGGLTSGITMLAGPSKHFKSAFALLLASAYLQKHKDAVLIFYDSEFGTPKNYFESFGIDPDRVLWTPVTNVGELNHDLAKQLEDLKRDDHVIFVLDSMGNLASVKESQDALDGKAVADMTRARSFKSLFRQITAPLGLKDFPFIIINHTYQTMEMFSKTVVGGGTGATYGSSDIWIIGRQQDKDSDKDLLGYHFIIRVEKSRQLKEGSKIPITVSFDGGIKKYSGLLELAEEGNFVAKPTKGKYQVVDLKTGELIGPEYKEADIVDNAEVWEKIIKEPQFKEFIAAKFLFGKTEMFENGGDDGK